MCLRVIDCMVFDWLRPPWRHACFRFRGMQVDEAGTISLNEFKGIMRQYLLEQEGENMISDTRIDQLLADAKVEAFRGRVDVAKLVEAMAFKR